MLQVPPIPPTQSEVKDFTLLKISVVALFTIALAGGAGYFFSTVNLATGSLLTIIFGMLFTLQTLLVRDKEKIVLIALIEAIAVAIPFFRNLTANYAALILLFFLLLVSASLSGRREMDNSFKIPFFKVSKIGLTGATTAVFLFVGAIYLGLGGSQFLSDKNSKLFIDQSLTPIFKILVPNYKSTSTAGEFFTNLLLKNLSPDERAVLEKAPSNLRDQIIKDNISKFVKNFEGFLGPINLKSTFPDIIYKAINTKIAELEADAKILLSLGALLILWFLIHSTIAFPLIYLPISIFSYLIYELLLMSGFILIQLEMQNKEVIVLR